MNTPRPMLGQLLGSVIFVDGPAGSSAAFTTEEMVSALRFIYAGGGVLRRLGDLGSGTDHPEQERLRVHLPLEHHHPYRDPATLEGAAATFGTRDKVWLDDAFVALGFPNSAGKLDGARRLRCSLMAATFMSLSVADAFPILVTKYACFYHGHGYQAGGVLVACWPRVLTESVTSDKPDRFFAHEMGHVFGAPDEYAGQCTTTETNGPFRPPTHTASSATPLRSPA